VSQSPATELLRPGLLEDVSILALLACGCDEQGPGSQATRTCTELGAAVHTCQPKTLAQPELDAAVIDALEQTDSLDLMILDGAGLFASNLAETGSGRAALRACMDTAWSVTQTSVNHAFLPAEEGGRIVYLAPSPEAGEYAQAAAGALENLARTLSIEWARHAITTVAIATGEESKASEVGAVVAYLASPAGAYFSGCVIDLRGAGGQAS
jgi:NAD(P)-dependent dehydrogenase (short-subunit alcohol dehydrogenase family)